MVGKPYGQRYILEHHGLAHSEAQPAAPVEIARGSRTSVRIVSNFGWNRPRAATGAGAWSNHRRRVRLADVVQASSNRLGVSVIDDGSLVQWAICIYVDEVLNRAGHERCGSRRHDRFSSA